MGTGFSVRSVSSAPLSKPVLDTLDEMLPSIVSRFSSQILLTTGRFLINCSKPSTAACQPTACGRLSLHAPALFSAAKAKGLLRKHFATSRAFSFIAGEVGQSLVRDAFSGRGSSLQLSLPLLRNILRCGHFPLQLWFLNDRQPHLVSSHRHVLLHGCVPRSTQQGLNWQTSPRDVLHRRI